ncbi:MAG: Gfo/Idh/MocA family oxidoreductase [Rhodobacteraceae bacterium]|nr:Gfo/Idh/MocA family oxidoreductase [Paracoccaceae bacterium]
MAQQQLRWGILGTANIARQWLCPALQRSKNGYVAGVASRTLAKAEEFAAPYRGAKTYGDYEAMLADPDIDAIYIPLPNGSHVEWTLKCLEAGKHVLCEKPIALKADQIDALIEARDRTGKFAAEAFMIAHHPQWTRVRELIAEGAIGKLKHVQGAFSFFNDNMADIRNRPEDGGGALRDIGVYPVVSTRLATGAEPISVRSHIEWDNGIDATARATAEFPDFTMDFYVSMRMSLRQSMVFHGDKGFLTVLAPFNAGAYGESRIEIQMDNRSRWSESFTMADQYVNQFEAFYETAVNGAEYPCTLEFSKANQRMLDMVYEGEM